MSLLRVHEAHFCISCAYCHIKGKRLRDHRPMFCIINPYMKSQLQILRHSLLYSSCALKCMIVVDDVVFRYIMLFWVNFVHSVLMLRTSICIISMLSNFGEISFGPLGIQPNLSSRETCSITLLFPTWPRVVLQLPYYTPNTASQ